MALFKGAGEAIANAWQADRARQADDAAKTDLGAAQARIAADDAERALTREGRAIDDDVRKQGDAEARAEAAKWSRG